MKVLIGVQEMYFGVRGDYGGEVAFGWDPAYQCYPQLAAYITLAGWILWTARRHLGRVARAAFSTERADEDEAMSHRAAAWGFALAVLILVAWFVFSGVRLWVAVVVVLVYFAIAVGARRILVTAAISASLDCVVTTVAIAVVDHIGHAEKVVPFARRKSV